MVKNTLLTSLLPHVPFTGWTEAALKLAAKEAGLDELALARAFPEGVADCVDYFGRQADEQMVEALKNYHLETLKIREKVALAVKLRIEPHLAQREAIRRAVAFYALHPARGTASLYRTVDDIWHAIGDRSTDFNFYTKRLMLAGVYTSTVLFWLDDQSAGQIATWEFLARRIENVMQIEKTKGKLKRVMGG